MWAQVRVMNPIYARDRKAQPRSTKRTKSTLKPTGPSLTQTWVCPPYWEMFLYNLESRELRATKMNRTVAMATFPSPLLLSLELSSNCIQVVSESMI